MQAKRQNLNLALLSLWSLAKMVIEMVARGVVVSTVWIWVSDKIWTMGVTKNLTAQTQTRQCSYLEIWNPLEANNLQNVTNMSISSKVHGCEISEWILSWKKKIRLSIEQPRYLNVLATGYLGQSGSCFTFFQETSFWQKGYGPIPICNGNSKLNFLLFYCALCYV